MSDIIYIPPSLRAAEKHLKEALASDVEKLSKQDFMKAYCSLAYLYPGFHPDGIDDWDGPTDILKLGREAWRRVEAGELTDNELYPYQATKARFKPAKA
jgi:hypothetical protein